MNIKKLLHLKNSKKSVYSSEHVSFVERIGEDAYVGWAIITSISFIVALILIFYAGWLFYLINSGSIKSAQNVDLSVNYNGFDQKSLDNLINSFEEKSLAASAASKGYEGPPDPSQ